MKARSSIVRCIVGGAGAGLALGCLALLPNRVSAVSHSHGERVCDGFHGGALALCLVYCERLECDLRPRRPCEVLHRSFQHLTGSPVFPCDTVCGDGVVNQPSEQCDGSVCADGQACRADCTCPPPLCGNGVVDAGEQCDGAPCQDGQACRADCTCPPPLCGNGVVDAGEGCDPPGSACASFGVCGTECTCQDPNPECRGSECGSFASCGAGSGCQQPICATTAEGGGICLEGAVECSDLTSCSSSADCAGGVCVVNSCCGRSVCVLSSGLCPPQ